MDLEKTVKNLKNRGFGVSVFDSGEKAAEYLCEKISGKTVGIGGSLTAKALALDEKLGKDNTVYWHWTSKAADTLRCAGSADVYLTSANAISENGEIVNIDGTGNRLAGQVYGHEKVYIVAGINKLCGDLEDAIHRARHVAAVQNCQRLQKDTPCRVDGRCHDCRSPQRICNALLVLMGPMTGMETEVVLINEDLGY